jgi:N-acetyl-1-D-myo-inositol-2-amino-2-deoxy-alpha-D-glucopyranoside deacetylase
LRQLKPQVVLSFGPEGVYGHYDHLAVHRWATAAVQFAAEAGRWPELGPAHDVAKFYHRAMPQELVQRMEAINGRSFVPIDGIPFSFWGYPMETITTVIDVRDYAEHKLKGIRCHASQLRPENPYLQPDFNVVDQPWFCRETFILARRRPDIPAPSTANGKEDDFFVGLR